MSNSSPSSSWETLEARLPTALPPIIIHDDDGKTIIDDNYYQNQNKKIPIFYRDLEALNPYCQQVWLALETKGVEYLTVLMATTTTTTTTTSEDADIDTDNTVPRIQWPDGTLQSGSSLEMIERIQQEYKDIEPDLYRRVSLSVDNVRCNILRFNGVFPRGTNMNANANANANGNVPNSISLSTMRAPFIFTPKGTVTPRGNHMVSLETMDECCEEYDDGPFLCGDFVSAADLVWGPFLERLAAQLPLIYDGVSAEPRSSEAYEALSEWFDAMEEKFPSYVCRVGGDKVSWENVLKETDNKDNTDTNAAVVVEWLPSRGTTTPTNRKKVNAQALWNTYAQDKPYLCKTPQEECVAYLVRHRTELWNDYVCKQQQKQPQQLLLVLDHQEEFEVALREVIGTILLLLEPEIDNDENDGDGDDDDDDDDEDDAELSENARHVVAFVNEQLRVPRDMGILPASYLRSLIRISKT